jgi:hypothetical protein
LHWTHPLPPGSGFFSKTEVTDQGILFRIEDDHAAELAEGEVTMKGPDEPRIDSLHPETTVAGISFQVHQDHSTLAVLGANFVSGAVVLFDGQAVPTTFGESGFLSAAVHHTLLSTPGTVSVHVRNPDGRLSNKLFFRISTPAGS